MKNEKQIFEKIEERGFKVGAISPMNAQNRLKNPSYFLPDPWTDTQSDVSSFSKRISLMLKQTVNDNSSGRLTINSILTIIEIVCKTLHYSNTFDTFIFFKEKITKFFIYFFKCWSTYSASLSIQHKTYQRLTKKSKMVYKPFN